jgi:hypothetical protein
MKLQKRLEAIPGDHSIYFEAYKDTLASIKKDVMSIIGEDFPKPPLGDFWDVGRNQLRAEQRKALEEYIG